MLLLCLLPIASTNADPATDEQQIESIRALSNEAIAQHDAVTVASLLAPKYQITTGKGQLFQDTPEAEVAGWEEVFATADDIIYVRTPKNIEISTYLPRAAEHGTWLGPWTTDAGRKEVGGSYAATWSRIDGEWKILSEVFVTLFCNGPGC